LDHVRTSFVPTLYASYGGVAKIAITRFIGRLRLNSLNLNSMVG
jgi:hypothetical protein